MKNQWYWIYQKSLWNSKKVKLLWNGFYIFLNKRLSLSHNHLQCKVFLRSFYGVFDHMLWIKNMLSTLVHLRAGQKPYSTCGGLIYADSPPDPVCPHLSGYKFRIGVSLSIVGIWQNALYIGIGLLQNNDSMHENINSECYTHQAKLAEFTWNPRVFYWKLTEISRNSCGLSCGI